MSNLLNKYKPDRMLTTNQEPSGLIETTGPSRSTQDEERLISESFAMIRKKHDETKESNNRKRKELAKLNDEIKNLEKAVENTRKQKERFAIRQAELLKKIEEAQSSLKKEESDEALYLNMLGRLSKEKLSLEHRTNDGQFRLKSHKLILDNRKEQLRLSRDKRYNSRIVLSQLERSLSAEKQKKQERVKHLEISIREQASFFQRKKQIITRRAQIAEEAAVEDRRRQEAHVKEKLLLHKCWALLLKRKIKSFREENKEIQEAFHRVKLYTGLGSIDEIVEKFLTREDTYTQLSKSILMEEERLSSLNQMLNEKTQEFKEINMQNVQASNMEINAINEKITDAKKLWRKTKENYLNTKKIYDQCRLILNDILEVIEIPPTASFQESLDALSRTIQEMPEDMKEHYFSNFIKNKKVLMSLSD